MLHKNNALSDCRGNVQKVQLIGWAQSTLVVKRHRGAGPSCSGWTGGCSITGFGKEITLRLVERLAERAKHCLCLPRWQTMDIYGWKGCSSKSPVTETLNKKADKKSIFDMKIARRIMAWRIMSMQRFTSVNRLCSIGRSLESLSTYKILNIYTTHLRHISSVDSPFQSFDIFSSPSSNHVSLL